ncbi:MAG: dicarboxylate/amino acid:cation symporter [Planctomycetaceae bacterium]|nr:dicarboxylate/amino acid:cation symporter [Planctomycetaceae bacterium]
MDPHTEPSKTQRQRWPLHFRILAAMVVGTVIGLALNPGKIPLTQDVHLQVTRSDEGISVQETVTGAEDGDAAAILFRESFASDDEFRRSYPRLMELLGENDTVQVPVTDGVARVQHEMSGTTVIWQRKHNEVPAVSQFSAREIDQLPAFWKQIATEHPPGVTHQVISLVRFIGDLFLRLLKMVTVPLIATSLITGVAGLGAHGGFGRMFGRTLFYYLGTSLLAITTGIILVNIIQPGVGATLPGGGRTISSPEGTLGEILIAQLLRMIPQNPVQAFANGEFLSIISFSILFGMFINVVGGDSGKRLADFFDAAFHVMMRMTTWIIGFAPIGVFAFMLYATATQGFEIFGILAKYMITVFLALLIHGCVTLPVLVRIFGRRSPVAFAKAMTPSLLTAFSTASSNAALPLTMSCVEQRAGVSNRTSSFVLPLGATINMDGTALYEAVAVLFIAQATPGFDLTLAQQITVAITALLASVGAAGIPHAGLVMMAIVLQAVGLPLESQGIIIAVDRILDMCRTTVNVWSDSCGCAVIDRVTNSPQSES